MRNRTILWLALPVIVALAVAVAAASGARPRRVA